MKRQIAVSLKLLVVMILITGGLYPGMVTFLANLACRKEAQGSLIEKDGRIIGSDLIGQEFKSERYFWSRPSVNSYDPLHSGGTNFGRQNPSLIEQAIERKRYFSKLNNIEITREVPPEMITSSGSGLDPHISPEAALVQVQRVTSARGLDQAGQDKIVKIIENLTERPQFSILGKPRINVFHLNLMLDSVK